MPVQQDPALVDRRQAGDEAQDRGFPARWSQADEKFSIAHFQGNIITTGWPS